MPARRRAVQRLAATARRSAPVWLSLLVLVAALALQFLEAGMLVRLRHTAFDYFQRWKPRENGEAPVRIVDIDEASLAELGQWPWPRTRLADLVDRLNEAGAAVVAFDVLFREPDRTSPARALEELREDPEIGRLLRRLPDHDALFAEALGRMPVVLGLSLEDRSEERREPVRKFVLRQVGGDAADHLVSYGAAGPPLEVLERAAAGQGAVNRREEQDGVVRRVPVFLALGDLPVPSLGAEAVRVFQGEGAVYRITASPGGIEEIRIGQQRLETDRFGFLWLHYSRDEDHPERYVPAREVLAGTVDGRKLRDHIVFVGSSAVALHDRRLGSLGEEVPGVSIHAQAVEQMLEGSYLRRPSWALAAETLLVLALWFPLVRLTLRSGARASALLGAAAIGLAWLISWLAFEGVFGGTRLLLDPVFPSLTALGVFIVCSVSNHMRTERDQRWIQQAFRSYISPNLVDYLIAHPEKLKLGGERRTCSFVFTDLGGFTTLVEKTEPERLVGLLDEYLAVMTSIARDLEGTIDRVVGDAVAVMFSAPVYQPDHARRAVECALKMDDFSRGWSAAKLAEGLAVGRTRIGVHTGTVTIGNVGSEGMFDYRALGDAVNTASRLESVNRHLGTRVCVSGATAEACEGFAGRPVGDLLLKGKERPVAAFEPLPPDQAEAPATLAYLRAFALLEAEDPGARAAFEELTRDHPEDPLARFHLERLRAGESGRTVSFVEK